MSTACFSSQTKGADPAGIRPPEDGRAGEDRARARFPGGTQNGIARRPILSPSQKRPVELLIGLRAICAFLRVHHRAVASFISRGAPIVQDHLGRYMTEKAELWHWLRSRQD